MSARTRRKWLQLLIALAVVSCTTDEPTGPVFRVSTLTITGGTPDGVLVRNTAASLQVEVRAITGALLTGRPVIWSTADASIAMVNETGVVTAKGFGTTTITAESEGRTATRVVVVRDGFIPPAPGVGSITASALNDSVRLVMPGGAVPDTLRALHVRAVAATPADARLLKAYEFGPSGSQFNAPLTLRIRYDPTAVTPARERAQLRIFEVEGSVWTEIAGGSVDTVAHEVIAPISHFSQYAVLRRATPTKVLTEAWSAPSPLYSGVAIGGVKTVTISDALDRPVPRAIVRFTVTAGSGTILGPDTATTDAQGRVTFGGIWRSGPSPAANVLAATVDDYPSATAGLFAVNVVLRPALIIVDVDSVLRTGTAASVTPAPWTVQVTNGGEVALTGLSVGTITYSAGASDWLSASFDGGATVAPAALTLTPNISARREGTYTARVPVLSAVPGVAPVTLTYAMTLAQAPPVALSIQSAPGDAVSGEALTVQPVIRIADAFGDRVTGAAIPVRVSVSCTGACAATLRGDTIITAVDGVANFTNLRLDGYGPSELTFSAVGLSPTTQTARPIVQQPRTLAMVTQPSGAIENRVLATQPVLQVLDAAGIRVRGSMDVVVASLATGNGALIGTVTRGAVDGIVTFTNVGISLSSVGASIRFTQSSNSAQVVSSSFNVLSPARVQLSTDSLDILGTAAGAQPSVVAVSVGNAGQQALTGLSAGPIAYGVGATGWLTAAFSAGNTVAPTTLSLTPVTTGIKQGAYTARVPVISAVSGAIPDTIVVVLRLAQAPAVRVAVVTPIAGAVSGLTVAQQPVVRILDFFGDQVLGSTAPVTLRRVSTNCPAPCAVLGDTTITAVNGVATFTGLRLDGYGPVTFEVTSPALASAILPTISITQQEVTLSIVTQPSGAIANAALATQPVLQVLDAAGIRVRGSSATVGATLASGTGALVGATSVAAIDGVITYDGLGVNQPSVAATIRFTQATNGAQVVSSAFSVLSPAAIVLSADSLDMQATAAGASPTPVQVTLTNGGQQAITGLSLGPISYGPGASTWLTANFVGGVSSAPTTVVLTPNSTGVKSGVYLARVPVQSSVANTPADTIVVVLRMAQAPAVRLTVMTALAGATSGAAATQQPIVRIEDAFGDRVVGASVPVTMRRVAVSCPEECSSSIVGDTVVTSVDGITTFAGLRLDGFGPIAFEFTASGLTSASHPTVTLQQQATALQIVTQPNGATENVAFTVQPAVHVVDAAGLRVRGSTDSVTTTLVLGTGALSGTTERAAVNGVVAFTGLAISQYNAAAQLRFTLASTGSSALSTSFTVASVVATLNVSPDTLRLASLGAQSVLAVDARDAGGAVVAAPKLAWRALNVAVATVDSVGKVVTVGVGSTKVIAEVANRADTVDVIVTQVPVAVTLAPDTARLWSLADTLRLSGSIRDAVGSVAPGTLTYASLNSLVATVSATGLVTANAVGSALIVATFGSLSDTTLVIVTISAVAASAVIEREPGLAVRGDRLSVQPIVTLRDNAGALLSVGLGENVTVAITSGAGSVVGTTTVQARNGMVRFTDLAVVGAIGSHVLIFTVAGSAVQVASSSFVVMAPAPGILVKVDSGSVREVVAGSEFDLPLVLDLSDRGGANVAALDVSLSWNPTRITFAGESAAEWIAVVNTTQAATGSLRLVAYAADGETASSILRRLRFVRLVADATPDVIAVTTQVVGNQDAAIVAVSPRVLSVVRIP